jgi:phospholipid-binding lipoprotein MlaA
MSWWQIAILAGIEAVDTRSEMLQYDDLLSNSLDPYSQMRDFYLLNAEKEVSGKIEMAPVEEATPEDLENFMDEIDE